jgi:hypothetical protein
VRPSVLDLRRIPNFQPLVAGFSPLQLSVFCRVLALLVFEPEDHDQRAADANTPSVSRSVELLQLRRARLAGASGLCSCPAFFLVKMVDPTHMHFTAASSTHMHTHAFRCWLFHSCVARTCSRQHRQYQSTAALCSTEPPLAVTEAAPRPGMLLPMSHFFASTPLSSILVVI